MPKYLCVVSNGARIEMAGLAPDIATISPELAVGSTVDPVAGRWGESVEVEAENPEEAIKVILEEESFARDGVYYIKVYPDADSVRREERPLATWEDPALWE